MTLWALALSGCADPLAVDSGQVAVRVWATEVTPAGGWLVVQSTHPVGRAVSLPVPEVDGLTFSAEGAPVEERAGDRAVLTQRWRFTGKKGSYEIPGLVVSVDGEGDARSLPLWVDLGVTVSAFDAMEDIAEPGRIWAVPWRWIGGVALLGALVVGTLGIGVGALASKPRKREVALDPPDVRCLRAWEAVRADASLSDDDKAKELSRLFREYTEEVLQFPAVSWTTSEILARLESMVHLPKGNVPRAKKLLRATDLVKYAEVSPENDFFDEMDADLRAFVGSTRPNAWRPDAPEAPNG